ncbi:MAG: putative sulfate exporter family transporter, partial [Peptostreptococcus sp.]|nr:putative sulfate exporter family transporter [Peptostreptococcus sp.]
RKISILVGVGSSICGGSAIAATAPVVDADSDEIAQAISVIFFFNIIAALIFPILGDILGLSNSGFAVFAGTAINDTSSVTAAASSWDSIHKTGSAVLDSATIVKLTRTLAIIPITFCLSLYETKKSGVQEGKKINFLAMLPRFILYFILCSIITSLFDLAIGKGVITGRSASMVTGFFALMKKVSKFFIVMAMGAIGLNTNIVKLIKTGGKPLLLGATCWISIILVSLGMQFVTGLL